MAIVNKIFDIILDTKRPPNNREIELVEDDTGNVLHISLFDDGEAVDLTGCRVVAVFARTGGTTMQDSGAEGNGVTISGNEITIALRKSSYGLGTTECELQVYSGTLQDTLVTTARFNFGCRRAIFNSDTAQATNEYPILVQLIADANEASQNANAAAGQVTSAATAAQQAAADAEQAVKDAQAAVEAAVAATVEVGTVTTGAPGTEASVTNSGTKNAAVLDFTIPRGDPAEAQHAAQHAAGGTDPITPAAIGAIPSAQKGAASGVATLDANSKVAAEQASAARTNVTESRALTADDAGKFLLCYNANVTITIPAGLPIGMEVEFCRWGATTVTLAAANGVTIHSVDSMKSIGNQYGCVTLKKATSDEKWLLAGDLG